MSENKMKCPMCAELIDAGSQKCEFCGEIISRSSAHPKQSQPQTQPPKPEQSTSTVPSKELTLYHPNTAGAISVFLTPVFGAFCMMRNWQALKQEERAKRSKLWMIGVAVYYALLYLFVDNEDWFFCGIFGGIIVWALVECRAQISYLKANNIVYQKRSWMAPVLKGLGVAAAAVLVLVFFSAIFLDNSLPKEDAVFELVKKQNWLTKVTDIEVVEVEKVNSNYYMATLLLTKNFNKEEYQTLQDIGVNYVGDFVEVEFGEERTVNTGK